MIDQYVGKKMGSYDIVELVGKGGMAAVYRAHQPSMNRSVAIKIMTAHYGDAEEFAKRFINEAHLIAQLEHAHILPVFDFGEQEGVLYIVMRYLSAGTLGDRIPEGGMPMREAANYFRQVASALDYAHKRGVIHRDLKPGNILIDAQDSAFLTDFGIAKSLENETNLTGTGGVVGTPTYMSPEQGMGDPLDGRSDIYAMGVILYEMLTGRQPFIADTAMACMLKHINEPPPPLRNFRSDITRAVEAVVMRALAKDRNARYSTALEMADALDEAIATDAVPRAAAAFTTPEATLTMHTIPATGGPPIATMPSPIAAQGAPTTAEYAGVPGAAPGTQVPAATRAANAQPAEAIAAAPAKLFPDVIPISLNSISAWLSAHQGLGAWVQAGLLSLSTYFMLARLTNSDLPALARLVQPDNMILALLPGLLYALLRAPTLGALVSMALVLVPLAARAPALAILWVALIVIAGSRLNSREIMLTTVSIVAASMPIGWIVPLMAPWWIKARRTVLAVALGAMYASLFSITLGWPNARGLLPVPRGDIQATIAPLTTSYFGLLEPSAWAAWGEPGAVIDSIKATFAGLGDAFAATSGLPLVVAAAWALASVLSVSNLHSTQAVLRGMGLGLGLVVLIIAHVVLRTAAGVPLPELSGLFTGLAAAILAVLLTQWPFTADPNKNNKIGTVLRLLRQTMGALFMALGVSFFAQYLVDSPLYELFWLGGIAGTLAMITNPLIGPPLVYGSLVVALAVSGQPVLMIMVAALMFGYLLVTILFDKRRPRSWNPLGAGFILGAPGMGLAGLLPLGPLTIGALEAQVPAAILALMAHVLLFGMARNAGPLTILIHVVTTLVGVLLVERLMGSPILDGLNNRLRRLLFTVPLAALMAVMYYTVGRLDPNVGTMAGVGQAIFVSMFASAALVAAMGRRAEFWREFGEREEPEAEYFEDEDEITGRDAKKPVPAM